MPCWEENIIKTDQIKIQSAILNNLIDGITREAVNLGYIVNQKDQLLTIRSRGGAWANLNTITGEITYSTGSTNLVNIIKRNNSMAIVKYLSSRGRMASHFKAKQVSNTEIHLRRKI